MITIRKLSFTLVVAMLLSLFSFVSSAFAEAKDGFSVHMLTNEELQMDGAQGWIKYDVKGQEGETIEGQFVIVNHSDEKYTLDIEVSNGLTTPESEVYVPSVETHYSKIVDKNYQMSNVIKGLPNQVVLNRGGKEVVEFTIEVPENHKGFLIGGIRVVENVDERQNKSEGFNIIQQKAHTMGIWLIGDSVDHKEVVVGDFKEEFDKEKSRLLLEAIVKNDNPLFLKDVNIPYKIIEKSTGEIIIESERKIKVFSPMNHFKLKFDIAKELYEKQKEEQKESQKELPGGDTEGTEGVEKEIDFNFNLEPGDYILEVGGKTFEFKIEKEEIKEMEKKAKEDDSRSTFNLSYLIICLLLVVIILLALLLRRKNKEEEKSDVEKVNKEFED